VGTRGTTGFIIDGTRKSGYQQYDSYPSAVGKDVLTFARTLGDSDHELLRVKELARKLKIVPEDGKPTVKQAATLAQYTDSNVSTGNDWYATLRNTQGKPDLILESGYITGNNSFNEEEYDYVLDLDHLTLIVYSGHHKLTAIGFDELPSDEDFIADIEARENALYAEV
jgi:hypothetical protein